MLRILGGHRSVPAVQGEGSTEPRLRRRFSIDFKTWILVSRAAGRYGRVPPYALCIIRVRGSVRDTGRAGAEESGALGRSSIRPYYIELDARFPATGFSHESLLPSRCCCGRCALSADARNAADDSGA